MGQAAVDNGANQSYCRAESIRVIQLNYLKVKNMKGTILLGSETYFVWKKDRKRQTAAQNRHDIPNFGTSLVTIIAVKVHDVTHFIRSSVLLLFSGFTRFN